MKVSFRRPILGAYATRLFTSTDHFRGDIDSPFPRIQVGIPDLCTFPYTITSTAVTPDVVSGISTPFCWLQGTARDAMPIH